MFVQLVVAGGNREGQIVPVTGDKFIIGRAEDCHLKSRSELISRYHCAILVGNEVVVRDLGSKNGVRLNGEKIAAEHKISNGDRLGVGPLEFFVHITASMETRTDDQSGTDIGWTRIENDTEGTETCVAMDSNLVLNPLKPQNQESNTVPMQSEQNLSDRLKKFL